MQGFPAGHAVPYLSTLLKPSQPSQPTATADLRFTGSVPTPVGGQYTSFFLEARWAVAEGEFPCKIHNVDLYTKHVTYYLT
jgi:hypothetical protein